MTPLVPLIAVWIIGLFLAVPPWKPVAIMVAVVAALWFGYWMFFTTAEIGELNKLLGPALLLGWAAGLLLKRTLNEWQDE